MANAMSKQAWSLLLLLSAIWGASFLFIEMALVALSPASLVFFRVLIGAMTLGFVIIVTRRALPKQASFWLSTFVMGAINNVIPFTLIAYGQVTITGGMASIINANTAFFGVLVAAIFIVNERLSAHRLFGVIIGVSGVVIVVGPSELSQFDLTSIGQLAVILATLSYAFASVWGRLKLQGYDSIVTAFATTLSASLILGVYLLATQSFPVFDVTISLVIVAIGLGMIGTGYAYMIYFRILALAGASNLMLVTIIVPIFAVTLDAIFLSQWVSVREMLGFGIIALGLAVMDGRVLSYLHPNK
ncbi:MAG: DMT family transporter [Candidatus Puniceispirillaceae bacterium]